MAASRHFPPTSIIPTGSPSLMAQGTDMAGWPVTSKGEVFGSISKARWQYSASGASRGGSGVAFIGRVGMRRRSYAPSTRSYSSRSWRARFCALA